MCMNYLVNHIKTIKQIHLGMACALFACECGGLRYGPVGVLVMLEALRIAAFPFVLMKKFFRAPRASVQTTRSERKTAH